MDIKWIWFVPLFTIALWKLLEAIAQWILAPPCTMCKKKVQTKNFYFDNVPGSFCEPCAEQIIKEGIKKKVYTSQDPNTGDGGTAQ